MADYKRKKVKKSILTKNKSREHNNEIFMESKNKIEPVVPQEKIKVVRGAKYSRKAKNKFLLSLVAIFAVIYFVLSLILPVSLYENVVNVTSLLGHGKYPIDASGYSVIDCVSKENCYYVLTDTSISAFSNSGKIIFNELHGFSNPILSTSATRAIVYDQGGTLLYVYNLSGKINSLETKNEIITASISNGGAMAVVTHSNSFTSVVNVYDKNLKNIFTWNSAKDLINNAIVNNSENKLAVTSFNAVSGQYNSKMMILDFELADPLQTIEFNNTIVLSLCNTGKGISVITSNKYKFVNWNKFNTNEISVSGEINLVRKHDNGLLIVYNRANDRSDNTVLYISKKGVKTKEFKINNLITDIQFSKGRVYCLSDSLVNIYDSDGNILRYGDCMYGAKKIAVISPNAIAAVSDTQISKIEIDRGVE